MTTAPACPWCAEPVASDQPSSILLVGLQAGVSPEPVHMDCLIRLVLGGVNHQQGLCACFGGSLPQDPPSLSKREAARVAATYWRRGRDTACMAAGSQSR